MKLYGMGQSRSFRALWALEESGLEYEYIAVKTFTDADDPASASNENYLKLNTQGKVPTLVDGELILIESGAILNHIGRSAPAAGLIPEGDLAITARYDELCCFILTELEQPLWSNGKHRFALPEEHRIPAMLETATFEFAKAVATLDQLLEDNEFAIGNRFSMVDILLAQTFNWALRFEFKVPQKYRELRERHFQRPAAQKCLALVE
ncbi:MAG: glutathione S-transferase family protein [Gammaproteobacteria bacterium]|jgi:glutathione S-transferase|nr:glutathione S-transferase [Gammaproteobacteria bacterium]MDP6096119.1 glutathione S-transferase family protein [Gammaproteobacteria bacterium]MDP7456111.1 glutathione S-transferase family protein [Gammaproteobacteria bacterium]HJO12727.1 glutathione S-transferase family protein [Gammaproteobacteria bacterium]|tara:strand:- start:151 stop:774 length:624 start_codon:yes stop_codon:yes gene_type:complete